MKDKKIKQKNNNQKMNNNTAKTFRGSFNAIHDSQKFVDTDSIHLDIHNGGVGTYYGTMMELFYKNMRPIHHIIKRVTDSCTTIIVYFYFEKGVPFFVNHEQVLDFEEFLHKEYLEIFKFFDHNKKESLSGNFVTFHFDACAYNPDNNESKDFKQSEIRQVTNVEELLLLYANYMDSLFVYDNYDFVLKDLFLIIRHSNDLKLN